MKVSEILLFACLAWSGCASRPPDPTGTPTAEASKSVSGAYQLSARITDDTCTPSATPIADTVISFVDEAGRLRLSVPDLEYGGDSALQGFAAVFLQDGLVDLHLDRCAATHVARVELVDRDAHSLTVRQKDTWTGLAHLDRSCIDVATVPTHDCQTSLELHYELDVTCEPPCSIAIIHAADGTTSASCQCHQG